MFVSNLEEKRTLREMAISTPSNLFIVIVETNSGHAPLFSPPPRLAAYPKKSSAQRIDSLGIVSTIESGYRSIGFLLGGGGGRETMATGSDVSSETDVSGDGRGYVDFIRFG